MSLQINPTKLEPDNNDNSLFPLLKTTLQESLLLFLTHRLVFLSIFLFLSLPLSALLLSLSSSSYHLKSQILRLHSVASLSPTRFEARQVWKESREDAVYLIHLKLLYFLPCYILSLAATVAAVSSSESGYSKRQLGVGCAVNAVKTNWLGPLTTSICSYAVLVGYAIVPRVLGGMVPGLRLVVRVVGSGFEVYLMAVTGMGMVVSVVEKRVGWEAIRVGSRLMEGRRVCGWVLSGVMALATAVIGGRLEGMMETDEEVSLRVLGYGVAARAEERWWERVGLVVLYGVLVVWGYVMGTVFYCECRKRQFVCRDGCEVEGGEL